MSDTKIPTAKEFRLSQPESPLYGGHEVEKYLIEFAKIHVQAALKAASEKAEISGQWGDDEWKGSDINTRDNDGWWMSLHADEKSILEAYPLDNIK